MQRWPETAFGNDPAPWVAAAPTPGRAYQPGDRPVLTLTPLSRTVPVGATVTFIVQATGPTPLQYRWRRNGAEVSGAYQASLTLNHAQLAQAGRYQVVVSGGGESVASPPAVLTVVDPPIIHASPTPVTVAVGQPALFSVVASSRTPMRFSWRHNEVPIPVSGDSPRLALAAAYPAQAGQYDVVIESRGGSITSAPAALVVSGASLILQPPVAQSAPVGGSVTFGVVLEDRAVPPFGYRWLKHGVALGPPRASPVRMDFLTLNNLEAGDAGLYSVNVTDAQSPAPGETSPAVELRLLPDTDGDGLPDEFETRHGLLLQDPADASRDADADGASNLDEYRAGTDPRDARSVLRVEGFLTGEGVRLWFMGAADRTFTLQAQTPLSLGSWQSFNSIPAVSAESGLAREVNVLDPQVPVAEGRYYRVISPAQP